MHKHNALAQQKRMRERKSEIECAREYCQFTKVVAIKKLGTNRMIRIMATDRVASPVTFSALRGNHKSRAAKNWQRKKETTYDMKAVARRPHPNRPDHGVQPKERKPRKASKQLPAKGKILSPLR